MVFEVFSCIAIEKHWKMYSVTLSSCELYIDRLFWIDYFIYNNINARLVVFLFLIINLDVFNNI